ncbi:polysaccharide deacetylase family protein [Mucilaginibacter rubeus]|uniref:Polysaccharide deacetylase family protein n=1 Tax=Mucilaginibacter rubeus TaxID=2027860 RepID=A0AAE6JJH1_9SPHI|nr:MULTISPECIES: polysaccharide deacetylase family protein [Mucilaginibacter]QEM06745.1 polysaccharide deacetylase family protein [Mucilaginibacter rubeus]QEM19333.1 polysaccharide deacetylase family protein [Mucilaginibacter gossypii]QTE44122.1 polysaccharide deacetylase family protein [Mucilaginibacter rubeus]QTE50723.1 polysaccharide deacetylase family protein [Mucilaginibacter rubeus]QTE55805.1 polysaccharide deacetylase family protein [Mucilaginibacter rubeus]
MLNFRNTNILFAGLLGLIIWQHITEGVSWWSYPVLIFIYSLILFYGCYYIGSNFFMRVMCSLKTNKKIIAITFDDGPDATATPQILNTLKQQNIPAAFFCIGNRIPGNEVILKQIHEQGHIIGNHSFSHHFWFDLFSSAKMLDDMLQTNQSVRQTINLSPLLFRPPYGVINPNLKKAILQSRMIPIGWSVRSMDTVINNPQKLLNKITRRLNPGAIFLFHDTGAATISVLPLFIEQAKAQGYEIVRLDKILNLQAYA